MEEGGEEVSIFRRLNWVFILWLLIGICLLGIFGCVVWQFVVEIVKRMR
jgi:nitrate reductase NapE component